MVAVLSDVKIVDSIVIPICFVNYDFKFVYRFRRLQMRYWT